MTLLEKAVLNAIGEMHGFSSPIYKHAKKTFESKTAAPAAKRATRTRKEPVMAEEKQDPWKGRPVGIERAGTKITLPSDPRDMSEEEAIEHLHRHAQQANMKVSIYEEVNCFPLEGAYALMKVLEAKYGWANTTPTPGFWGPNPPVMVTLEVGWGRYSQIFWGGFQVPGIEGQLQTSTQKTRNGVRFCISGEVKKKFQPQVKEIADLVRKYVSENSIYKGQAIKITTVESQDQACVS